MKILFGLIPVAAIVLAFAGLQSAPGEQVVASFVTPLDGRSGSQRHNARLAVERLDGARIEPGAEFSFNRRVGTFSRDMGYRKAPVSYNGQLINDWGGGVCQASTTLYNAALLAGLNIIERHRHQFQPSYVPPGRDAAVAFSNIDLRFQNPYDFPLRLHASIEGDMVRCELIAPRSLEHKPQVYSRVLSTQEPWTFEVHKQGSRSRVRNTGKVGWEVAVYRVIAGRKELVSQDSYPVMHRVIQVP
jgi:vancomycin resistance protein YoaR